MLHRDLRLCEVVWWRSSKRDIDKTTVRHIDLLGYVSDGRPVPENGDLPSL